MQDTQQRQAELLRLLNDKASLREIQSYLGTCHAFRGFDGQGVKEKMLLLTEEVGELAKAIRRQDAESTVDGARLASYDSVESEIADVFIVLISICNLLEVDLFEAFRAKEEVNVGRRWG